MDGSRGFGTNGMGLWLDNNGVRKENLPKRVDLKRILTSNSLTMKHAIKV